MFLCSSVIMCLCWHFLPILFSTPQTKHIEVDFHYVREKVIPKDLYDRFVSGKGNSIDYLNKPLTAPCLIYLEVNSWWIPPPFIWGGILNMMIHMTPFSIKLLAHNEKQCRSISFVMKSLIQNVVASGVPCL